MSRTISSKNRSEAAITAVVPDDKKASSSRRNPKNSSRDPSLPRAKFSVKTALLYVVFAACAVCSGDAFDGAFAFGLFVGAVYTANPFVSAVIYLASSLLFGETFFVQAGVRAGVILLFVILHNLVGKKIRKILLLAYLVLANVFYCVYRTQDNFELFDKLLATVLAISYSYVCIYTFRALFVRGLVYRPALDEIICIAMFCVANGYAMSSLTVWNISVIYFVIPFLLLFCAQVLGDAATLVCAALVGLGNLLSSGVYDCAAFAMFCAVAVICGMRLNRFVAGCTVIIVDVLMSYFLNLHGSFSTIVFVPTMCSVLVFFVIPGKVYDYLADCVCGNSDRYLGKSVVKKLGLYTAKKLYRLSDIFLSMKNAFLSMTTGALSEQDAEKAIVRACADSVCKNCAERTRCWRQELDATEGDLLLLSRCAVKRGKCSILDVPQALSLKCVRISTLIAEINVQCEAFREYTDRVEQVNGGKKLLGEQLGGVSQLLTQLASDCKGKISYSSDKEKELVERLVFHNILCCGAVIMEQSGGISVIATISKKDVDKGAIEQITGKLLNRKMSVDKVEPAENSANSSWVNVYMSVAPRFGVNFGVCSAKKEGSNVSGDTHSVIRTDNGKCIVALCDGMGSGNRAEQMSATAIGLVENFYRAGFDNDTILSCINHLLVGSGNEIFCAVDICVLDLSNGLADLIKLGAPVGLVRCGGTVEIVAGSSLPLGVLDEMRPSITKKAFSQNDMAVLCSDGVTDCFNDPNALAQIFADSTCTNPQSVAEEILAKALRACGNRPKDDMTVVVAKVV